jgi:hypothetical protein
MENKIELIFWALIAVTITIAGLIITSFWYELDLRKCSDISDNEYYYTQNNCWETINTPNLTKLLMFIVLTILPFILWLFFFGVRWIAH